MAEVTYRVDDLDGKTKVTGESTNLSLNGRSVTIDLSPTHEKELADFLAKYFENGVVSVKGAKKANGHSDEDHNVEVRAWAKANGHKVSERGRLSKAVLEAYENAQGHASVDAIEAALNAGEKAKN